ncbi:MAG: MmcQ/YjbR family DNA-binding protein [Nannocystales bacterium]
MTYDEFNRFCESLRGTSYVMQWGGSHVWKVGAKVFAIGGLAADSPAFIFKVDAMDFAVLCDQPGLRPAPYFASRGMKWVQHFSPDGPPDAELRGFLQASHRIVAAGLTRKARRELGFESR